MRRLVVTALGLVLALVPALLWWTVGQAHVAHTLWGSPASDPRHLEIFVAAVGHGIATVAGAVGVLLLLAAAGGLGRRLVTWSRAGRREDGPGGDRVHVNAVARRPR